MSNDGASGICTSDSLTQLPLRQDRRCGATDDLAIAENGFALCDIGQGNLVALRDLLDQPQAAGKLGTGMQASAVGDDRDVIVRVHADIERLAR